MKANNKYMEVYNKNKESLYLKFQARNDLCEWTVSSFQWVKEIFQFNKDFIKSYNEDSYIGYFFEVDIQYPEELHGLNNDLPFLPGRMKMEKIEKLLANLYNKKRICYTHKKFKTALNHGLVFKKGHRVIKFNQEAWLKPYIYINTENTKNQNT